jgi:LysM repeat protein
MQVKSSGNPNVVFVFAALVILLLALVTYISLSPPTPNTMLSQLPQSVESIGPEAESSPIPATATSNPDGEKLLKEVLDKPLDVTAPKETDNESTKESIKETLNDQPLDPQQTAGTISGDSDAVSKAKAVEPVVVTPQFTGQKTYAYSVRTGETLYRIAGRFRNPAAKIKQTNALPDDNVTTGQVLELRIQGMHKVVTGEGLAAIARAYGVPLQDLRRCNELTLTTDALKPGQELIIPLP